MTTYYLRADGSNANTGLGQTAGTAWLTLAHAATTMAAGDRLEIMSAGGTFFITGQHSFKPVGSVGNLVTITNFAGQTPIFDGTGGTFSSTQAVLLLAAGSTYADVGGFVIRNNAQGSAVGRGLGISSSESPAKASNLTLRNITIHDVNERGLGGGGDNITIISCEVYAYALSNINQALGGGNWATGIACTIYSNNTFPTGWTIQDCYVHDGWGEGIDWFKGGAQDAAAGVGCTIEDCIVENAFSKLLYVDNGHGVIIRRCYAIFNDTTYQRDARNSDGIAWSVEGANVHTSYGINNLWIYNNVIAGVRDVLNWFTSGTATACTYKNVKIWHNSTYSVVRNGFRTEPIATGANAPSGCELRNNIIDGTITTFNNTSAWTCTNNDWWNNGVPALGTHTVSFSLDPLYTSPSTAYGGETGFAVSVLSPCINAGVAIASVTTDFLGNPRNPLTPTVGAFEQVTQNGITGSFLTGTGAVASTISVTGVGFVPKALVLWWNGRTEAIDTVGSATHKRGIGFAVSPTDRRAGTNISIDAVNPTDTAARHTDVACVSVLLNSSTVDGELDLQSMDADGFTLVVDNQFATSYRIFYMAIGGEDVVNAASGQSTIPTVAGNASVTGLPFQPDCVLLFTTRQSSAPPLTGVDSILSIGAAVSASSQAVWAVGGNGVVTPSQTIGYARSGECLASLNNSLTVTDSHAVFVAFTADGFTLNWTEVSGTAVYFHYLAIKGGSYTVGTLTTQTDTVTAITAPTPGYTATAGIFVSACRAESTSDTVTDNDQWSMGGFSSATQRDAAGVLDEDNVATSDTNTAIEFDAVYANVSAAGAIQGLMDITSVSLGAVSLIMDDADPSAAFVWYLTFGPAVITPPTPIPAPGAMGAKETQYFIRINDAFGNPMPDTEALFGLQVAQANGQVGAVTFSIPGDYPVDYLRKDGVIEVWRHPQNRQPYLLFNKIFFLRRRTLTISNGHVSWSLTAYDPNYILSDPNGQRGRIVAYPAESAYTSKAADADDMIKEIARENIGSLATDTTRSLATYLSIQADIGAAPSISKSFSNRVLLPVFNEICAASVTAGTYLAWDIVCTQPPASGVFALELQTFVNYRGLDHRAESLDPVLIGVDYGNLDEAEIDEDWTEEESYVRVGGKGEGVARVYASGSDATRLGESPFNRREAFLNFSNVADPATLADEVDAGLRAGVPRPTYRGRIVETNQARFDLEWGYGDYLTAQVLGRSFDARVDAMVIDWRRDAGERITAYLKGEDVTP